MESLMTAKMNENKCSWKKKVYWADNNRFSSKVLSFLGVRRGTQHGLWVVVVGGVDERVGEEV